MNANPEQALIYHITDVENLPAILGDGGLYSEARMSERQPAVIGYAHIKERRLKQIQVACCGGRFVGEFVPFYFCPRSPMLFTINKGATGRPQGCQRTIIHLVSRVIAGIGPGRTWAVSDGNAGHFTPCFSRAWRPSNRWTGPRSGRPTGRGRRIRSRRSFWWRISFRGRDFRPWVATTALLPKRCRLC